MVGVGVVVVVVVIMVRAKIQSIIGNGRRMIYVIDFFYTSGNT